MIAFLVALLIAVVATVASVLLQPKVKQAQASASSLEDPTNSAGREMGVVFGEGVVKSGNVLWFGEKDVRNYTVKA